MNGSYQPEGYCPYCGYRLDPGRCPECGQEVPRPRSKPPLSRRQRLTRWSLALLITGGLLVGSYFATPPLAALLLPANYLTMLTDSGGRFAEWARQVLRDRFDAREATIAKELETLGEHAWGGRYDTPFVSPSCTILIAPESGFTCLRRGWYWRRVFGQVEWLGDQRLRLTPAVDAEYTNNMAVRFVIVPWGPRQYLIPEDEMVEFCNAVNAGGWGSWWPYRINDPSIRVQLFQPDPTAPPPGSKPKVPPEYAAYVLSEPIMARATALELIPSVYPMETYGEDGPCVRAIVTLDVGARQGVLPGMRFHLWDDPIFTLATMTIEKVSDTTCSGPSDMYLDSAESLLTEWGVKRGSRFCTREPEMED